MEQKQSMFGTGTTASAKMKPRIIIHGGAGNIIREGYPAKKYQAYRAALLTIVTDTAHYMNSVIPSPSHEKSSSSSPSSPFLVKGRGPSALEIATHAVTQLEDNALFNSGHGAVFTRDGINELEASVMLSRGAAKRAVGVMGLQRVRNPILLARRILEHGEQDLAPRTTGSANASSSTRTCTLDVPSAQGHSQLYGEAAEALARRYGLEMADPAYFFTQQRWDEHVRALERERRGEGSSTWDAREHLPQGTVGAVALDAEGIVCVATSTGGMTNKLTGRIGDTPSIGAGFWAEEWAEESRHGGGSTAWNRALDVIHGAGAGVTLAGPLKGFLADCLPTPWLYSPLSAGTETSTSSTTTTTTKSIAISGTGNGDSFLRTGAARTVAAMARWKPEPGSEAVRLVAGRGGELQRSAGDRWGRTGEGEGGMIGIEAVVVRDAAGRVVDARSEILMDFNCGGMYRAWADEDGKVIMSVWTNGSWDDF